jgi:hypothetical protein
MIASVIFITDSSILTFYHVSIRVMNFNNAFDSVCLDSIFSFSHRTNCMFVASIENKKKKRRVKFMYFPIHSIQLCSCIHVQ